MLRRATVYDWVGDPVPGKFHLLHNPARTTKLLDLEEWYPRMLAHCDEYLDSVGDNFLNLAATLLGVNAYALTGRDKYRDWTLEYLDAWKERAAATGGMIPSNIGLDGTLGGAHDGQWWKGTYGWNFTIFDGELEEIAHRNYFTAASFQGFANGLLLTGDQSYIDVLRKQMDLVLDAAREADGQTLLPTMYGDPRGYAYDGEPSSTASSRSTTRTGWPKSTCGPWIPPTSIACPSSRSHGSPSCRDRTRTTRKRRCRLTRCISGSIWK